MWHEFQNPARGDTLTLHHWMKEIEKEEVYPFARFNRKVEVIQYTDEEYEKGVEHVIHDTDWNKVETDHLFRLCEKYSLRFIIIADRFEDDIDEAEETKLSHMIPNVGNKKRDNKAREKDNKKHSKLLNGSKDRKLKFHERTVDEIKDRYYAVAKAVLEYRG